MLSRVWLKDFRNFSDEIVDIPGGNHVVLFGRNNQGKTNFLEAVYFLCQGNSFRESAITHLIRFDKPQAIVGGIFSQTDHHAKCYAKITSDGKKQFVLDDKPVHSLTQLRRRFPVDYISADIIAIFQQSPEFRRKVLDRFCSIFFSEYPLELKNYEKILKQKNTLLKQNVRPSELIVWNRQLCHYSARIVQKRVEALRLIRDSLSVFAAEIDILFSKELIIAYCYFGNISSEVDITAYEKELSEKLTANTEKEKSAGFSLYGCHRDDFFVEIDKKSLFSFYSRGINRLFAILFKLSELELLKNKFDRYPLLLLDDTFAEMDKTKKQDMITLMGRKTRLFYASVLDEDRALFNGSDYFMIENGKLTHAQTV